MAIGKQDQHTAAFGGMTVMEIAPDGSVEVRDHGPTENVIA